MEHLGLAGRSGPAEDQSVPRNGRSVRARASLRRPVLAGGYAEQWLGRRQILRAYDDRGWIHPASRQHDGDDPVAAIESVLAKPGVVELHSRNVNYGCYMFAATHDM